MKNPNEAFKCSRTEKTWEKSPIPGFRALRAVCCARCRGQAGFKSVGSNSHVHPVRTLTARRACRNTHGVINPSFSNRWHSTWSGHLRAPVPLHGIPGLQAHQPARGRVGFHHTKPALTDDGYDVCRSAGCMPSRASTSWQGTGVLHFARGGRTHAPACTRRGSPRQHARVQAGE